MNKKICELKKENKLNEKNNIFIYLFRKLKIKNQAILVSWSERPLQIGFLWFMGHKLLSRKREINSSPINGLNPYKYWD